MDLMNFLTNLLIGIAGGIFSSVVVSKIFLLSTNLREQINRVQEHFESLYMVNGFFMGWLFIMKSPPQEVELPEDMISTVKTEISRFGSMRFDDLPKELHRIAIDLSDTVDLLRNKARLSSADAKIWYEKFEGLNKAFYHFKNGYKSELWKLIVCDKILWVLFGFFFILLILTIFIAVF